jgi:hypothetical protein
LSWASHSLPPSDADVAEAAAEGERMEWRRHVNQDAPKAKPVPAKEFNLAELAYSGYFQCKRCGAIGLDEICGRCGAAAQWQQPVPAPTRKGKFPLIGRRSE